MGEKPDHVRGSLVFQEGSQIAGEFYIVGVYDDPATETISFCAYELENDCTYTFPLTYSTMDKLFVHDPELKDASNKDGRYKWIIERLTFIQDSHGRKVLRLAQDPSEQPMLAAAGAPPSGKEEAMVEVKMQPVVPQPTPAPPPQPRRPLEPPEKMARAVMMMTTSKSASAQVEAQARGAKGVYKMPDVSGPSHGEALYATTSGQYSGAWNDATAASITGQVGDCPTISEVLALRGTKQKPIKPLVNTGISVLAKQIQDARDARLAEKVLSADVIPKKFPVEASQFTYPGSAKKGADNPLYATSSQAIGREMPLDHQISDRYFPGRNEFTKTFVEKRPRNSSLATSNNPSKIHKSLDEYY